MHQRPALHNGARQPAHLGSCELSQAVAVQLPDSLARFTPDAAHVTISVAEGRSKKDAGERVPLQPLTSFKNLNELCAFL